MCGSNPRLGELRQENREFEDILGYMVKWREGGRKEGKDKEGERGKIEERKEEGKKGEREEGK